MNKISYIFIPQDFWHGTKQVGKNFSPGILSGYYLDLTHKTQPFKGIKSAEGVPLVYLRKKKSYVLHPVTVCQVALGWHERWLHDNDDKDFDKFIQLADWLVGNQVQSQELGGFWPIPISLPVYGLESGWISALVQGQAISVLAKAFKTTEHEKYISAMQSAVKPFFIPVGQGGVKRTINDSEILFEEYPSKHINLVLNGLISSMWGIYDYLLIDNDESLKALYKNSVEALENNINKFDTGYWSKYSLFEKNGSSILASPYYHTEHIEQLKALSKLTDSSVFIDYANKWARYSTNIFSVSRVVLRKSISRILNSI